MNGSDPIVANMMVRAMLRRVLFLFSLTSTLAAESAELKYGPLPYPVVNSESWVLIEIWPEVGDITLSAYFMDISVGKNENLCEATKRSLDRDANAVAKEQKRESTSYRQCLTVGAAIKAGYIAPGDL